MQSITIIKGDIFSSNCNTLVNPINCVGVMGAGLALQFKQRCPNMFEDYRTRCAYKLVRPGEPYICRDALIKKFIINFPTKDHWRDPSNIAWIADGMTSIVNNINNEVWINVSSIAFPLLGAGCGGLDKNKVFEVMQSAVNNLHKPMTIELYHI